jgi:hypothetical protein
MNADEVIERFCSLQQEVVERHIGYDYDDIQNTHGT